MVFSRSSHLILILLLLAPFSQLYEDDDFSHENRSDSVSDPDSGSYLKNISNPISSSYKLSGNSGLIHSHLGSFDPLYEGIPSIDWNFSEKSTSQYGVFFIVQSTSSDLQSLISAMNSLGVLIVDHLPDNSLIVSIPPYRQDESVSQIDELDEVRWSGKMPFSWKMNPHLTSLIQSGDVMKLDFDIILHPFLNQDELTGFSKQLTLISKSEDFSNSCDFHLCQLRSVETSVVSQLLQDNRVLKIELGPTLTLHNSNASLISGISDALSISSGALTGEGEVIGISDTGLDADHGDFDGRLRSPVFNQFGPDNSGADANSGHGTHVAATLLGDGSGDQNSTGMIPSATFHFYQLEVDSSGLLARWGSLYEMFQHSFDNDARIQTNSWGSSSGLGDYTADSRSVDDFTYDNPLFLALFSSGDYGNSGISPPSTSKNALSIGSSNTGSFDSIEAGNASSFSSMGPTSDGRIKPDLIAPGVMICSARAEEAEFASGEDCSESSHDGSNVPLYMALNGSSMATPVAAGAAAMVRQFLREELAIANPRSDLIRAILVNGAEDLGTPNVPNPSEGWGQLNLSSSLYPRSGNQNLSLLLDYGRQIIPGHSFLYSFEVEEGFGFDATLAWNDMEGSSSANQNASRLVSDLDLIITSPDGAVFLGNHFVEGFSSIGGERDDLNNLERVKVESAQSGIWTVEVGHSGGINQDFSFVVSAAAQEIQNTDLTVFENSIFPSNSDPLQGDTISIQISWSNQAAAASGGYSISLVDVSKDSVIHSASMSSLGGGETESFSIFHSFSTTGEHLLRLTLDDLSEVDELNDENSGINNNVYEITIEVTQIGVRITPLLEDGSLPSTLEEISQAQSRNLDPSQASWVNFDLELRNEGTSEITVALTISQVQEIDDTGILEQPEDEWRRNLETDDETWTLSPFGESGDRVVVTLNLTDYDADLSDSAEARYALPGSFVNDLLLYDVMAPTIFHSLRLHIEIERVEGLFTIAAGTDGLGAEPGDFAQFSISVKNIGNGPTQYEITCDSPSRWPINIGSSQSNSVTLGPLSRLQFVPVPIKVRVPPASSGLPAGETEIVSCTTTSVNDPSLQTLEQATVEVFESQRFTTQIFDQFGEAIGPLAISDSRAVLNGDYVSTSLLLKNTGNVAIQLEVKALSSSNTWPIQLYISGEEPPTGELDTKQIQLMPGEVENVTIRTIVPLSAQKGDRNTISIKTTLGGAIVSNGTLLEVREITTLDIDPPGGVSIALGRSGTTQINLHNPGNVPLSIDLTMGTLPEGWSGGFLSGRQFSMDMNRDSVISIELQISGTMAPGKLSESLPVIIKSTSPSGSSKTETVMIGVTVLPSVWISIEGDVLELNNLGNGVEESIQISINNLGNTVSDVNLEHVSPEGWDVSFSPSSILGLVPGSSMDISLLISPKKSAEEGLQQLQIFANSTLDGDSLTITNSEFQIEVSKSRTSNSGGMVAFLDRIGLPPWSLAILFVCLLSGTVFAGFRLREQFNPISSEEDLIPQGSALKSGSEIERRTAALETSTAGEVITGGVSDDEIEDALSATLPTLPTHQVPDGAAPLPISGLPPGWTMDQWVAYGHIWWEQNSP